MPSPDHDPRTNPSLEDLGLDSVAELTPPGKLSIEELQRQSEREMDDRRPSTPPRIGQRAVGMDIAALMLSLIIPGAGQAVKGRFLRGLAWFVGVAIGYVCFVAPGILLHIWCIADAVKIRVEE